MFSGPSIKSALLLYFTAIHGFAAGDTGLAPLAATQPTPVLQPTDEGAPAAGPSPLSPTGSTPTPLPGSNAGGPNPPAPLAPAFDPDAVCAPFPDILSSSTDPVTDFACNSPANTRESSCMQYPGCRWVAAQTICSGAFDPDACAQFTIQQCNASPFCTGADNSQAAAGGFANGVPPPLTPTPPLDGGGTAGPNADPVDPLDYDDGEDYTFTSSGTASGDGVAPGGGGGGGGGGGSGGSPSGTGVGRGPEFGTSGGVTGDGQVTVSSPDEVEAVAPFELPEPGTLLDSGAQTVATAGLSAALLGCALAMAIAR